MKALLDQVKGLSIEDLRTLNTFVVATIKSKKGLEGMKVATQLKVNMVVKVDHKDHKNTKWTIQKINRTKAVLTMEGSTTQYNVPFNMIIVE